MLSRDMPHVWAARRHGLFSSDAGRGGVVAEGDFGDAISLFALSAALRCEVYVVLGSANMAGKTPSWGLGRQTDRREDVRGSASLRTLAVLNS